MPLRIYIAEIRIDQSIEHKIRVKHNLTGAEVREALVLRRDIKAGWENHPQHGRRLIALGHTYGG